MLTRSKLFEKAQELFGGPVDSDIENLIETEHRRLMRKLGCDETKVPSFAGPELVYDRLKTGKFSGRPTVAWNGTRNGVPVYVHVPNSAELFSYKTSGGRTIVPGLMDTDGGSLPRILWSKRNYSPWDYGPAFIIHDWLFDAHKCRYEADQDWTFEQAADIMAEATKTLMEEGFTDFDGVTQKLRRDEATVYIMYLVVRSPLVEKVWNDPGTVKCRARL